MPKVPDNSPFDPFGNYVKGKDQSRVTSSPYPPPLQRPSMAELLMAAAVMHEQGRLQKPNDEEK